MNHNNIAFTFASSEVNKFSQNFIKLAELFTGKLTLKKLYDQYLSEDNPPENFWHDAIKKLDLKLVKHYHFSKSIPLKGRLIVVANHAFGVADGVIPPYETIKSRIPSLNEEIYMIKVLAGSHSEVSAQLVRKGLFLGGFGLWSLFLYPMYLVSCKLRPSPTADPKFAPEIYGLIVPVFFSGLTTAVTFKLYLFAKSKSL